MPTTGWSSSAAGRRSHRASASSAPGTWRCARSRARRGGRPSTVVRMMERLESDTCRVRPNQVYLADGVARHFGLLGGGSTGTPGFVNPASLESTVRPAAAPRHLARRLDLPGTAGPTSSCSTPACARSTPTPSTRRSTTASIHHPWRSTGDRRAVGRRGRAGRRRRRPTRPPGRPRHVHQRHHPPAVPGCAGAPPRRAHELRRRRRRLGHRRHRAGRPPARRRHRHRRDVVRDLRRERSPAADGRRHRARSCRTAW